MASKSRELKVDYNKHGFRYFRNDEVQSDDEEDKSVSPFSVSELLIEGFYTVTGISSFTGRGVLNGQNPVWALKIGNTLFYFVWDTERRKDKQGNFLRSDGLITSARCISTLLMFASKYRIVGENQLGCTQTSPTLFEKRCKLVCMPFTKMF